MKHIKLFEEFLNENKHLEKDLARIVMNQILTDKTNIFRETVYLSINDREAIKRQYGKRLPRELAGPEKYMLASAFLTPLVGNNVYVDGTHLVVGDKTVLTLNPNTTWETVANALNLKEFLNEAGPVRYFLTVYLDKGLEMTYSAQELMTYVKDFNVAKDDLPRWLYQATLQHNKYSSENKNAVMRSQFPKLVKMDSEKIRYLLELIANHIFNRRENVEINISKDQSPALWYITPKAVANNSFLHTS